MTAIEEKWQKGRDDRRGLRPPSYRKPMPEQARDWPRPRAGNPFPKIQVPSASPPRMRCSSLADGLQRGNSKTALILYTFIRN